MMQATLKRNKDNDTCVTAHEESLIWSALCAEWDKLEDGAVKMLAGEDAQRATSKFSTHSHLPEGHRPTRSVSSTRRKGPKTGQREEKGEEVRKEKMVEQGEEKKERQQGEETGGGKR